MRKVLFRFGIVALSVASFWYWLVLPMPPEHDAGLNFDNVGQWLATLAILAFVSAWGEERLFVATSLVALGEPIAFLPYALFGFAYRRSQPLQLRWDDLLNESTIPAILFYFVIGTLFAILPALVGWAAKASWRTRKQTDGTV